MDEIADNDVWAHTPFRRPAIGMPRDDAQRLEFERLSRKPPGAADEVPTDVVEGTQGSTSQACDLAEQYLGRGEPVHAWYAYARARELGAQLNDPFAVQRALQGQLSIVEHQAEGFGDPGSSTFAWTPDTRKAPTLAGYTREEDPYWGVPAVRFEIAMSRVRRSMYPEVRQLVESIDGGSSMQAKTTGPLTRDDAGRFGVKDLTTGQTTVLVDDFGRPLAGPAFEKDLGKVVRVEGVTQLRSPGEQITLDAYTTDLSEHFGFGVASKQASRAGFRIADARARLAEGIGPAAADGRISIANRAEVQKQVRLCTGAALRGRQPSVGVLILS
jgi:hypothetical protein